MRLKLTRKVNSLTDHQPLNTSQSNRINRLVANYENDILKYLDQAYKQKTSRADRIADKVASFGGSWSFIILFAGFLTLWMIWNSLSFTTHFDAKPFILLNLVLSFLAAFQAPVIMMSQNRQATRDKHEAIIDFAINYKAELEVDDMQSHLHNMESQLIEIKKALEELRLANTKTDNRSDS